MATLTVTLDPAVLEAAKLEARSRNTTVEEMVGEYLLGLARSPLTAEEKQRFIQHMYEGPLGDIDRPLTREEIYAERTWPRS